MTKNQLAITLEPADRVWIREQAALQGRSESNFVAWCVKLQHQGYKHISSGLQDLITRSDAAIARAEAANARSSALSLGLAEEPLKLER